MNRNTLKGKWRQLKGRVGQQWGKLTDDDVERIGGDFKILVGRLQEAYGIERDEAERRADEWLSQIEP